MVLRFALGGISCECNGFAAGETETDYFRQTGFVLVRPTSRQFGSTQHSLAALHELVFERLTRRNVHRERPH